MKDAKQMKQMDLGLPDYSKGSRERLAPIQKGTTQQEDHLSTGAPWCASDCRCGFGQIIEPLCWQVSHL